MSERTFESMAKNMNENAAQLRRLRVMPKEEADKLHYLTHEITYILGQMERVEIELGLREAETAKEKKKPNHGGWS